MKRALLVDDESGILNSVGAVLEVKECEVDKASTLPMALEFLHNNNYEIVITDLNLQEGGEGYKIITAASKKVPRPRIIFMSGALTEEAGGELAEFATKLGADHLLRKPFGFNQIAELL